MRKQNSIVRISKIKNRADSPHKQWISRSSDRDYGYPLWALLIKGSKNSTLPYFYFSYPAPDQSFLQPMTGYKNYAGYRIKIKLICRLTKDRNRAENFKMVDIEINS